MLVRNLHWQRTEIHPKLLLTTSTICGLGLGPAGSRAPYLPGRVPRARLFLRPAASCKVADLPVALGSAFSLPSQCPPAEDAAETEWLDLGPACAWRLAWGSCQVTRETEPGDEGLRGEWLCEQLVDGALGHRIGSRCSSLVGSESLKVGAVLTCPPAQRSYQLPLQTKHSAIFLALEMVDKKCLFS